MKPLKDLKTSIKVTYENGDVKYYRYIRNEDDTFAFVEVDENGNDIAENLPEGEIIPDNYIHLTDNVYAVTNDNGVVIDYKERSLDSKGNYSWSKALKPNITGSATPIISYNAHSPTPIPTQPPITIPDKLSIQETPAIPERSPMHTNPPNGNNETSDGYIITYITTITKKFDSQGNLLSTKKDGPTELSRTPLTDSDNNTPDKSKIASTLNAEVAKMSVGVSFKNELANQVLVSLNAERAAAGAAPLQMSSGEAYQLAQVRASAMAMYDYSDYNSPLYGSLSDMLSMYGINCSAPSENNWRASAPRTANAIHARFMSMDGSKQARISSNYTNIGIAIVEKNGYYYICEVLIN